MSFSSHGDFSLRGHLASHPACGAELICSYYTSMFSDRWHNRSMANKPFKKYTEKSWPALQTHKGIIAITLSQTAEYICWPCALYPVKSMEGERDKKPNPIYTWKKLQQMVHFWATFCRLFLWESNERLLTWIKPLSWFIWTSSSASLHKTADEVLNFVPIVLLITDGRLHD